MLHNAYERMSGFIIKYCHCIRTVSSKPVLDIVKHMNINDASV